MPLVAMNAILESLGSTYAHTFVNNYYWSSSERAGDDYAAFVVDFDDGNVYFHDKPNAIYVRAVCAY